MTHGCKKREARLSRPPKGLYRQSMCVLDAVRDRALSPAAAHLWQVIAAYGWEDGYCNMTDAQLAEQMGGKPVRLIVRLRAELRAAGLLAEQPAVAGRAERRLIALIEPEQGAAATAGANEVQKSNARA